MSLIKKSLIILHLIFHWSLLSVTAYEIWSVYFDDTIPSINIDKQIRQQLVEIPFEQVRYITEITTYLNNENINRIRRMELSLCDYSQSNEIHNFPNGSFIVSPTNGATYLCLQRIASQRSPFVSNQTLLEYPQEVGLPINNAKSSDLNQALLLTIEYDQDFSLLQDDSGFDLYISDQIPLISAGIMAIGLVPDNRFFIPANITEWTTKGTCHSTCFDYKMDQNELKIVGMFPNTNHRYLDELTVEISSYKEEISKIFAWGGEVSVDLSEEPTIQNRDKISVNCVYKTTEKTIKGGLSDDNENCLVWMHYYPKLDLDACLSSYSQATLMSLLDVDHLNTTLTHDTGLHISTEQDKTLSQVLDEKDRTGSWNLHKMSRSKYSAVHGRQLSQCGWDQSKAQHELRRRRRRTNATR